MGLIFSDRPLMIPPPVFLQLFATTYLEHLDIENANDTDVGPMGV